MKVVRHRLAARAHKYPDSGAPSCLSALAVSNYRFSSTRTKLDGLIAQVFWQMASGGRKERLTCAETVLFRFAIRERKPAVCYRSEKPLRCWDASASPISRVRRNLLGARALAHFRAQPCNVSGPLFREVRYTNSPRTTPIFTQRGSCPDLQTYPGNHIPSPFWVQRPLP